MAGDRHLRILGQLGLGAEDWTTKRMCEVCAEVTGMTGAGVMLMAGDMPRGSICTTNSVSALIEDLQFELGEGPCVDAYRLGRPVLEPDLADPVVPRWVAFSAPVIEAGARAIFGFPLHVGAVRLGALNLYRAQPGVLTDEQHADALVMADVVGQAVLLLQADAASGDLATALEEGADFKVVIHQASGMIAAQLGVNVAQAMMRLRAYAFGNGLALTEVAHDVVGRRLRFDSQPPAASRSPKGRTVEHGQTTEEAPPNG